MARELSYNSIRIQTRTLESQRLHTRIGKVPEKGATFQVVVK